MPQLKLNSPDAPVLAYYAATLVFVLLDYGFGINIRVAFLDAAPLLRPIYYGVLLLCFVLMLVSPALTALIGVVESLVTLIALILSMALRVLVVSDAVIESGEAPVTIADIVNFLLSGTVAYLAWSRGLARLGAGEEDKN